MTKLNHAVSNMPQATRLRYAPLTSRSSNSVFYFNYILLSQLHQCDQGMLSNRFSCNELFLLHSLCQKTYIWLHFSTISMQPRDSAADVKIKKKKKKNLTRNADLYIGFLKEDTNLTRVSLNSQLHSLSFTCHHKKGMQLKIWLKKYKFI